MQPIVFNIISSTFNRYMEAASLRIAYLLGGRPLLAGTTGHEVYFAEEAKRLSVVNKMQMLVNMHKNDPETHAVFANMYEKMEKVSGIRTTNKEQLAARKSMEQSVNKIFVTAMERFQSGIDSYGFAIIRELKDEKVFGYLLTNLDPEKAVNYEITISDLMQMLVVESDDAERGDIYDSPELFFLGNEFLADEYAKPAVFSVTDAEAVDNTCLYLHHCFTFPYPNLLTTAELKTMRRQWEAENNMFSKATDEWCYGCYDNEDSSVRIAVFRDEVIPKAAALQQRINDSEIFQQYSRQDSQFSDIEVWMGEIPVIVLWQFYRDFGALTDDTWHKLQALKEDPEFAGRRWPVMMLKAAEAPVAKEEISNQITEEEITPVKKYLSID